MGTADFASFEEDGTPVEQPKFPFKLSIRATEHIKEDSTHCFQNNDYSDNDGQRYFSNMAAHFLNLSEQDTNEKREILKVFAQEHPGDEEEFIGSIHILDSF